MNTATMLKVVALATALAAFAARAAGPDYPAAVLPDNPLAYYRMGEPVEDVTSEVATNSGSLGSAADGLHFPGMKHRVAGLLPGISDTAAAYTAIDESSHDGGVPTLIPYNAELNTTTFTVEAWVKPTLQGGGNAPCPLFNRVSSSPRKGWVIYQRDSSVGWNLRMYGNNGGTQTFDITGGPYTVGATNHLVATFDGTTARLYVNGAQVGSGTSAFAYDPNNIQPLSIGSYNDGIQEPFTGTIDEVALYSNALSAVQVLAHYQNGTDPLRVIPYDTLVLADGAVGYYRLNEKARNTAVNSGTLASAANGTYAKAAGSFFSAPNNTAGPQNPPWVGFESTNEGAAFDGATDFVELGNPSGLNFTNQITLEAWILPGFGQNSLGDIIAHGGNDTFSAEVALRLDNGGLNYTVLSHNGTDHGVSFEIPIGDLGGGNWIHLVGTYNGADWTLYRNGVVVASTNDATGSLVVANANWAVGARGRWKNGSGLERGFVGPIDEAAIYNYALSPNQVSRHYSVGFAGLHPLEVTNPGGVVSLVWSLGTLQEADNVQGPYTDVSPAPVSPYTPPAGAAKKFYRLKF